MRIRLLIGCIILLIGAESAWSHQLDPGYLEITEQEKNYYSILWKAPLSSGREMGLSPVLPDNCTNQLPPATRHGTTAVIRQWSIHCTDGLEGRQITVSGLEQTQTDVLVRMVNGQGITQTIRLTSGNTSFTVNEHQKKIDVIETYLLLGIEHILLGIDHLLFVFALILIVVGLKPMLLTITAFTCAHSITLALATLQILTIPQAPVEAVIALSILFLASETVNAERGRSGLTKKSPWIVAFVFGLLHGLGFANALSEIGLPPGEIPLALLFFNLGVEVGQVVFVALVLLIGYGLKQLKVPHMRWGTRTLGYAIGSVAAFWTIERVVIMIR